MESGEIPPLVWSLSRKLRRRFCPRAAVLHYREARRGFDPDASETDRRINRLHRIVPESKYLRQLLLRIMREIFYRGGDDPDTLYPLALARCESDFRRMVFGDAPLVIDAVYRHESGVTALRTALRDSLYRQCRALSGGAWRELLEIPVSRRRFLASPLCLRINELACYASPLLAYSDRGKLYWVELRGGTLAEHPEVMLMHRYYALNRSGRTPEALASCQLDPETGDFRGVDRDFDVSATLRLMSAEAAAHREEMTRPAAEIPANFGNCERCVFVSYCGEKIKERNPRP